MLQPFLEQWTSESLFYTIRTSGSTGKPKIIQIKKEYMLASAKKTLKALNLRAGDRSLLCLPIHKVGGVMMIVRALLGELDLWITEPSAKPLQDVEGEFDFVAMVPYQVSQSQADLHRVKKLIIGGGPVNSELERKLRDHQGEVYHTYGMTETISHIALRRININKREPFKALKNVEHSLDDRSCLVIDAPDIGVRKLVTNDIVDLHNSQSFTWKGRYDNVVNSGGLKLFPEEIEQRLGELGYNYFLFGEPDPKLGERLAMLVETSEKLSQDVFKDALEDLDRYERPKAIYTTKQFEYGEGGKVNRKASIGFLR